MTETGKILELRGNLVIIEPNRSATCFGCMNEECKTGSGLITAENPTALPLKPGQMVEIKASGANILKQAMTAIVPPGFGFALGFTLTHLGFPQAGEATAAFIGVLFLFAAGFTVYLFRKKHPAGKEFTVTKINN